MYVLMNAGKPLNKEEAEQMMKEADKKKEMEQLIIRVKITS